MPSNTVAAVLAALGFLAGTGVGTLGAAAQQIGVDQWGISEANDAITDEKVVSAGIETDNGLAVMLQCSGGKGFGAVIVPTEPTTKMAFLTMDKSTEVAWRIDEQPAKFEQWVVLEGGPKDPYAVATPTDALAKAILAGGKTLTMRVHGLTTSVQLEGAAPSVLKAMSACGRPAPEKKPNR